MQADCTDYSNICKEMLLPTHTAKMIDNLIMGNN
jgi:hypothetical protein